MSENARGGQRRGMRIIAVDDEPEIGALLTEFLGKSGYAVRTALNGVALDIELARETADLILLDVNMPGEDGFSIARRLRAGPPVRIIMLTAANEVIDRVVGLEIGADDYVAKPFDPRELALRALAIHRRASHKDPQQTVVNGPLRLDVATRSTSYHGRTVHLSESEFRLCLALAERAGRPMTHDELIAIVWGSGDLPGGREMLKTSIWRLRLRLTQVNPVTVIESVRGTGYMMVKLSG